MLDEDYADILGRHRLLCVLLGLFFSWLLSFILLGPSLVSFAASKGVDGTSVGSTFALFHGLSLISYGIWGRRHFISLIRKIFDKDKARLTGNLTGEDAVDVAVMGVSCFACFGLTVAFIYVPSLLWRWLAIGLGLASGPFVITCASKMACTIPQNERGRAFACSMATANVALYIHTAFFESLKPSMAVLLSSGWLFISLIVLHCYSKKLSSIPLGSRLIVNKADSAGSLNPPRFFLFLAVLIAGTSIIGGFSYKAIFPSLTLIGDLDRFYNVLPYILMCFVCGHIADSVGRRPLANIGFLCLGLSMPAISLLSLSGVSGYLVAQTLMQIGYACIDVFLWVSLADIAPKDRVSSYYGIGLGLNIGLILVGMFIVERLLPITEVGFSNISLVATAVLFFAVMGLVKLEETLAYEEAEVHVVESPKAEAPKNAAVETGFSYTPPNTTGLSSGEPTHRVEAAIDHYVLNLMAAEYALTRRELDVVVLLLKGLANDEIQQRLCISAGTLKTHIRHIFQKLDISNRKELLVSFTHFLASYRDSDSQAELH
jgi:DNA-binding CsgD family transcriptional regulator